MVLVNKIWLEQNVRKIEAPKSKKNMKNYVIANIKPKHSGFETELTGADKYDISKSKREMCFRIFIPGYGWCGAMTHGWHAKHGQFVPRLQKKTSAFVDHSRDWDDLGYWNRGSWGA